MTIKRLEREIADLVDPEAFDAMATTYDFLRRRRYQLNRQRNAFAQAREIVAMVREFLAIEAAEQQTETLADQIQ